MRRIDRINLVLALLLAGLLWINQQPAGNAAPPLTGLDPATVSEIRVISNRRLKLALLRDQQGWMLTHPNVERASTRRVDSLLSLLKAPVRWQLQDGASEPARYGLDEPTLEINFDDTQLRFGNASKPAGQRYVETGGRVQLIDDAHYRIATLPARHFLEQP